MELDSSCFSSSIKRIDCLQPLKYDVQTHSIIGQWIAGVINKSLLVLVFDNHLF